jgi:hypothetical protein
MPLSAKLLLALCVAYSAGLGFVPALRPASDLAAARSWVPFLLAWGIPAAIIVGRWLAWPPRDVVLRVRSPVHFKRKDWRWHADSVSDRAAIPLDLAESTAWPARVLIAALSMFATAICAIAFPSVYLIAICGVLAPAVILSGTPAFRRARDE